MNKHAKLFEEFIKEEDPLADVLGGGGGEGDGKDKKKEKDPIKKMQDEEKKKKEKAEKKFDEKIDKKEKEIKEILDKYPEVKKEIGKLVINAVKSQDRVKVHNAINELIYLQVKYEKAGNADRVHQISHVKTSLDDLDHSYSSNKMM